MAANDSTGGDWISLPFVADVPEPEKPRVTVRRAWVVPDVPVDDYGDACRIGARWAAEYIDYERRTGSSALYRIALGIAEQHERIGPLCGGSSGFGVGFLAAIAELAVIGAKACGGAQRYGAWKEQQYKDYEAAATRRQKDEITRRVARMNAGKRAARARRDRQFTRFMRSALNAEAANG
jgi:hypothetical protein